MIAVFCFNLLGTVCAISSIHSEGRDGDEVLLEKSSLPSLTREPSHEAHFQVLNGCGCEPAHEGLADRAPIMTNPPLLDVNDLAVEFAARRTSIRPCSTSISRSPRAKRSALSGESGSGKSVTSYAVMRILDRAGRIADGSVMFSGVDVKAATESQMRDLRGREISMIFQNPRAALNPIRKVGDQIKDVLRQHVQAAASDRGEKAIEALEQVKIARPRERYHAYPFELSGGTCQRVVIALALACNPQLLIADEPTTGLDVTTQKAVMGADRRTDQAAGDVDHLDHPRPRIGSGLLRSRRGDGEGPGGRNRAIGRYFCSPATRLHQKIDARDAAAWRLPARSAAGGGRNACHGRA